MLANCVNINIRLFSIVDSKMADTAVKQLTATYESIGECSKRGLHPEEFLTYDFLREHPILLQPGMLQVDWNRIPGLSWRIDTIPTVVVLDSLWARWQTDWKDSWEPDEDPGHFIRNVALVVCRSWFNNNPDSKGKDKQVYSLAIAHVLDNIALASLAETNVTLMKCEPDQQSVICLTHLHKAAKFYPDYFCSRKKRQITLQHMEHQTAAAGVAANFAGAELLTAPSVSGRDETYSKLPPGYRQGSSGDLINTGGKHYKVWEAGPGRKQLDINDLPLSAVTITVPMPKYGDFPLVVIDVEPFHRWLKSRRPKEVPSVIPTRDPKQQPQLAGSTGSPAHHDNITGDSDDDSGHSSLASSRSASPARSAGSVAGDLLVSSSSKSGSDSDTPAMSMLLSGDEDQASGNESAGPSGTRRGSGNESDRGRECRTGGRGEEGNQESEDSSSDSGDDDTSDDGGGASEVVQHLEEVYSRILKALHKTAKIMCAGYEKATGNVQSIVQMAVQEVTLPNKTFIWATTDHLSEWGQAVHNMLNSEGASTKEQEKANREARLAGLRCVKSLLADGEAFNEAEEQDTDQRLHDTVQAALRAANKQADETLVKIIKRIPGIIRQYVPNNQAGTFITSVFKSMGDHYLSVHGMVMTQVVVPFHVIRGMYSTSGNMFRAINHVVPGLSTAATNYRAALLVLPAVPDQGSTSQVHVSEESQEVPLRDTLTGKPGNQERGKTGTPAKSAPNKQSSSKAPLMNQSRHDFKSREDKIQTGGTPSSKRGSGKKEAKLDPVEIAKTWESFEWEDDAHNAARRVLQMNPMPSDKALSLSDHEDHSIEVLTERDAPSWDETSGHVSRKHKEDTSMDEDEGHPARSSCRKKRKKHSVDKPDMFDSDFKGSLSFSKKSSAKPVSSGRSAGTSSSKTSKRLDDDSGLGSSFSEPKKSKDKKSRKMKSTGDADPLQEEL